MAKKPSSAREIALAAIQELILRGRDRSGSPLQKRIAREVQSQEVANVGAARTTQVVEEQRLAELEQRLPRDTDLKRIELEVQAATRPGITDAASAIVTAERGLATASRDLHAFKLKHAPDHEARFPPDRRLGVALVAVPAFMFDALASVFLLAGKLEKGILGGWIYVVATDGAIVVIAIVAANSARYLFHHRIICKLLGSLGLALCAALIAALSLAYAHFRDAAQSATSLAPLARATLASLMHEPFRLTYAGWLLWALGVLTGVAVGHAAFVSDDKIPGYGKVTRAIPAATEALNQRSQAMTIHRGQALEKLQRSLEVKVAEGVKPLRELHAAAIAHESASDIGAALNDRTAAWADEVRAVANVGTRAHRNNEGATGERSAPLGLKPGAAVDRYTKAQQAADNLRDSIERRCADFLTWFDKSAEAEKKHWREQMDDAAKVDEPASSVPKEPA
jgi:hypothetical protein